MKKRLLAILLTLAMVLSLLPHNAVHAADGSEEAPHAAAAVEATRAEKTQTVLTFTSDIHNQSNNTAANRLDAWLDDVTAEYGGIDVMSFCGDMGQASGNGDTWWSYVQSVKDVVDGKQLEGVYTTGNHEFYNGNFSTTTNALKNSYVIGDVGASGDNYIIYCLGTDNWNNNQDNYPQTQIDELISDLSVLGNDKPIIILTHYPLHYFRGTYNRQTTNANLVIDALNNAVNNNGQKIVLLWGHNHTVSDTHYDQIYEPGDSIEYASGSSKTINFYYGAAGCMSDSEYGSGSAFVKGKGLVITINNKNQLSFTYYDANFNNVTEGGTYTEQDPILAEGISVSPPSLEVEVGRSSKLTVTFTPADTTNKAVTWTSSDTSKATVDSNGKVKGVAEGNAVITATSVDGGFTASCNVQVIPRTSAEVHYVIRIGNYVLSTERSSDQYTQSSSGWGSSYTYTGLAAVAYSSAAGTDEETRWIIEETDGGYYIMSLDGRYLNATYTSTGSSWNSTSQGNLKLDDTPDVWVLDDGATLESWEVDGSYLKSTNASTGNSSEKYLAEETGNGGAHLFTVRSHDNADQTSLEEASDPVAVTGVTVAPAEATIEARKTVQLTATVTPENATNKSVIWSSSDTTVATVDTNGKVKGVGEGTAIITATTADAAKTATATIHVTPSTSTEQHFVIVIDGFALSTDRSPNTANGGSSSYTYTGLAGIAYTSGGTADDKICWIIEETEGGYYIKSLDGEYLNATYTSGSNSGKGDLKLDDTPDVWVLDSGYSFEDGFIDGSKLKSTNASATATSNKFLSYEDSANLFTVRSSDNADEVTIVDTETTLEVRYEETNAFVDGKEYIIAVTKDDSSVYAIKNVATGTTAANTGSITLTVVPASGSDPAYIETDDTGVVWKYASDTKYLKNKSFYLNYNNSVPQANTSGRAISYSNGNLRFARSSSSNYYYLTCSNGTFGTNSSSSSAASVRLFEKHTEIVTHTHTWGEPVWNWTGDVKTRAAASATATFACTECGETQTVTATVTGPKDDGFFYATAIGPDGQEYHDSREAKQEVTGEFIFTLTADKEYVAPGDRVKFEIKLSAVHDLGSMYMELVLPEELTFVEGTGELADIEGINPDYSWFEENSTIGGDYIIQAFFANGDYSSEEDTLIATFECTVTGTWTGTKEVDLKNLAIYSFAEVDCTDLYSSVSAKVKMEALTVTFNANEGTGTMDPQTIYRGQTVKLNANTFTRTGYEFTGWNTAADGSGTAYTDKQEVTLSENLTLYAQWSQSVFTVTFVDENGTVLGTQTVASGTAWADVIKPEPTKTGYTFAAWIGSPETVTADVTVTASYSINQYTITFDTAGGSAIAAITQDYGTAVTAPADPTKEGYTFDGWDKEIPATMPAENITITAKWKVNQYTITFDTAGGSAIDPITQDYGTAVTAPEAPTREGYTFDGWDKEIPATMPAENITITAKWKVNQYTITFDTAGGSAIDPITQDYGTAVTAPEAPTREGYTFDGWDKDIPLSMPAENVTITAKWIANTYTVKFDKNDEAATGTMTDQNFTYDVEQALTANGFAKENYTFAGWSLTADGEVKYADKEAVKNLTAAANGEVTLYAVWTQNAQVTVTFKANGAEGEDVTQTIYKDVATALTENAFTRTGYTFDGWNTKADGSGDSYADKATVTLAEDLILFAQWKANTFAVSDIEGTFTYTGLAQTPEVTVKDGETTLILDTDYTVEYQNNVDAGTATVVVTGIGNYAAAEAVTKTFVIGKAPLTVTAKAKTITYGDAPANDGVSYEGFVNNETEEVLSGTLAYTYSYEQYGNVGEYTIMPSGLTSDNYEITFAAGKLTVEQKEVGLSWGTTTFTYDGEAHVPEATATGLVNNDECTVTVEGAQTAAGTYTATAKALSNANYKLPANATTEFTIEKAAQEAPEGIKATDETVSGKNDGTISGLEPGMEYSDDGGKTWTTITEDMLEDGTLTGLEPGDYLVRNAGDDNHDPSEPVEVPIEAGEQLTVTFNSNGGSEVEAQSVDYNGTATKPEDPTKEGFIFGGWYSDEDLTEAYNFSTKVTANITLYAKWNEVAPEGYHIILDNRAEDSATTSLIADQLYSGEVTFTVANALLMDVYDDPVDAACLVAIVNSDGTYTPLVCTTTTVDGTDVHSFTVTVTDADVNLILVIKGDANLDGEIDAVDTSWIKQASLYKRDLKPEELLAANIYIDEEDEPDLIDAVDVSFIKQVNLGKRMLKW